MNVESVRNVSTFYPPVVTNPAVTADAAPEPARQSVQLPYISPVLQYDNDAAVAVLLFRDANNGDVETQYPSKRVVREYQLRGRESVEPVPSTPENLRGNGDAASTIGTTDGRGGSAAGAVGVAAVVTATAAPSLPVAAGGVTGGAAVSVDLVA